VQVRNGNVGKIFHEGAFRDFMRTARRLPPKERNWRAVRMLFKNSQISRCAGRLCTCWEAAGKDTARGVQEYGGDSGRSCQIAQCVPSGKDAGKEYFPDIPTLLHQRERWSQSCDEERVEVE
jgi:hypothetical protein